MVNVYFRRNLRNSATAFDKQIGSTERRLQSHNDWLKSVKREREKDLMPLRSSSAMYLF